MKRLINVLLILFLFGCSDDVINWTTPNSLDQDFMNQINKHREEVNLTPLEFNPIFFEQAKRFAAQISDNPHMREQLTAEEEQNGNYRNVIKAQTNATSVSGCTGFSDGFNLDPTTGVVDAMLRVSCRNVIESRNANTIGGAVFQNSNTGDYFYVTFIGRI
ncbi:CAP domain-containing protein [Flammeovirga aprica]|uniref:CAP domain-containing protein n=1 Tax=Flammeovirga aprica JL-4 TaxID=694437 RepID=A0A7X9RY53_9BACT|nr:hypothetical protein [Flammeovirga aprica]NME70819.1 CAP domain-containing protein [Flammeovirga aprica JL-4]